MSTANTTPEISPAPVQSETCLLVLLTPMPQEQLDIVVGSLAATMPTENLVIAAPDGVSEALHPNYRLVPSPPAKASWTLTAADFVHAYELAQEHKADGVLMLGPNSVSLGADGLRDLARTVQSGAIDLVIPHYELPPHAGLVNSALLYPLTRALFAARARFPLAIDLGLSLRLAERLAGGASRFVSLNQAEAPLWPVNEAVVAGFTMKEIAVGPRSLPQPTAPDLHTILPMVSGSFFADIEAKAAFWQRARKTPPAQSRIKTEHTASPEAAANIAPMLQAFQLAYTNLQSIWSLVLSPNSLLDLKRLYDSDATSFHLPESLWARIIYDFLLAYRLRTINRGHLLGALVPLYLAWVASHINWTSAGVDPEQHIEAIAMAFEQEKPYIVSRWRWPDRFNP